MEKSIGIEEARGKLGELADQVSESGDGIVLCRRGIAQAMLVDREEYLKYKAAMNAETRAELERLLAKVEAQVADAGLDRSVVAEAIETARKLD
jgi:PHD/YefM family antitoxin component YafN of YafNO toxin-antitoxin module